MHWKWKKTGSITRAANNLYMEQPNLSKAIKSLEESVGAPIFKRSSKGVVPTPRGKEFLEHARKVLKEIEKMEGVYRTAEAGQVEFCSSIPCAGYLNEAFSRFVKSLDRKRGINLWLKEADSMETMEAVAEGACQMGIVRYSLEHEADYLQMVKERELSQVMPWDCQPVLLMSRQHPLAGNETVLYGDLKEYLEIRTGDIRLAPVGAEDGNKIYISQRAGQIHLLQTNPDAYMWVSALPVGPLAEAGLIQKPCTDRPGKYRDVCLFRQDYRQDDYDRAFLHQIHKVRKELEGRGI